MPLFFCIYSVSLPYWYLGCFFSSGFCELLSADLSPSIGTSHVNSNQRRGREMLTAPSARETSMGL